jgi:hypothetical protein
MKFLIKRSIDSIVVKVVIRYVDGSERRHSRVVGLCGVYYFYDLYSVLLDVFYKIFRVIRMYDD